MISKIKYEHLLLLIAFFWLFFFSFILQVRPSFSELGDDGSYLIAAKKLYLNFELDDARPMIISLILGLPFVFSEIEMYVIHWGLFLNFCCWFLTIYLLFLIISSRYPRKIAFITSIMFVFCIGNLAIAFNFMSESIFICCVLWSMFFLNKYYLSNEIKNLVYVISILLFSILIKPITLGLLVLIIISNFKVIISVLLNKMSFLIGLGLILIFLQMYTLKINYGDYTVSYISSITYYNYLGAKADCLKKNIEYLPGENKRAENFSLLTSHEQKIVAKADLIEQIQNNTYNFIKAYLFCIYSNSTKASYIVSQCKNINKTTYFSTFYFIIKALSKLQTIIYTVLGVLLSFWIIIKKRKVDYFIFILSISVLYLFFISAISCFQCDRFHIVFFPLVLILIVKSISMISKPFFERLQK